MLNFITLLGLAVSIIFIIYGYYKGIFSSVDTFQLYMNGLGVMAPVIFVFIQAIQVIIPILPGAIGCVAGVLAFGPGYGFIYNYLGICVGSILAFLISKRYGVAIMRNIFKEKTVNKYMGWINKGEKFDIFFATAIFLPVAPDDFLCYLAGLTKMKLKRFVGIIMLGKPISLFLYSMGITSLLKIILQITSNMG